MTLLLPPPSATEDSCAFPTALIRHSAKVEATQRAKRSWREVSQQYRDNGGIYQGAQLMPLHSRDVDALAKLFDVEIIEAIDADIRNALLVLWPQLCWEDDPFEIYDENDFEFLADFL